MEKTKGQSPETISVARFNLNDLQYAMCTLVCVGAEQTHRPSGQKYPSELH